MNYSKYFNFGLCEITILSSGLTEKQLKFLADQCDIAMIAHSSTKMAAKEKAYSRALVVTELLKQISVDLGWCEKK